MSVTTESPEAPAPASGRPAEPRRVGGGLLDPKILWKSCPDAFKKLDPRVQIKNPVMFVVEVGSVLTLYTAIKSPSVFNWTIVVWLWLTVVFANLAEAVAEGRGKAQAETLRRAKRETMARRLRPGSRGRSRRAAGGVRGRARRCSSATTWWSRPAGHPR
jgi:K+-transporting ATPase ATPase B chain